jgi:hypothetical protein
MNKRIRTKEIVRNKKKMTFAIRVLAATTDSSNFLLMIGSDDPFTSYKYTMSLGDYCLLPVFFK